MALLGFYKRSIRPILARHVSARTSGRLTTHARPNSRAPTCCYACCLAAPARVLHASRLLLLLVLHVLLLRLHGRACAWGRPTACEKEARSTARVPRVDPSYMLHHGGTKPGGAGAPGSMSIGCWPRYACTNVL